MFQFANPSVLYLLLLIPLLALGLVALQISKRKIAKVFAQNELFNKLSNSNEKITMFKALLFICGIFFLILALARPQFGTKLIEIERTGSDVVIALDVSKNMLAQDIKPNRFERAKSVLSDLINHLKGNRNGLDKQKLYSEMNWQLVDRYQYILVLALICFLIEFILPQRKRKRL